MEPIIIANWKMHLTLEEACNKAEQLNNASYKSRFLLAPPAPYLSYIAKHFTNLDLCAQDASSVSGFGAYTGEYSSDMIKSCNVNYAIIGHSERRNIFAERNKIIQQKALNCINSKITPIICIGETLEARQNNNYKEFIVEQISESIPECDSQIIIAYEPYWAIGTGIAPTITEIAEIFNYIKTIKHRTVVAKNAQLVYGGSVSSRNYEEILNIPDNDGIMLGSASLNDEELNSILK